MKRFLSESVHRVGTPNPEENIKCTFRRLSQKTIRVYTLCGSNFFSSHLRRTSGISSHFLFSLLYDILQSHFRSFRRVY